MKGISFIDRVVVHALAGRGGNGCASFRRESGVPMGGPNGGDGGRGGHVILRADRNTDSLVRLHFAPLLRAEPGGHGKGKDQHGRNGRDLVALVPCGTEVWDAASGELLGDIVEDGAELIVARGGRGGLGNIHWKSATHQAPTESTPGEEGEDVGLRLELKTIADAGFVGLPNAGKSSLLRCISNAHPKVAPYPFTTLHPIIGTVAYDDYTHLRVADIPGLVEGAHAGIGLGHEFLRHIERSQLVIYVLDMAGTDGRDPVADYRTLRKELALHDKDLAARPSLVVANKMDLPDARRNLTVFRRKTRTKPLAVSALTGDGIAELRDAIRCACAAGRKTP